MRVTVHHIVTWRDTLPLTLGKTEARPTYVDVIVDPQTRALCFGPSDNLRVMEAAWRGRGLGTYLISKVIAFAQAEYVGARVRSLTLSEVDAPTPQAMDLRNGFYKRLGFAVECNESGRGAASVESVDQLISAWPLKHIERREMPEVLRMAFEALSSVRERYLRGDGEIRVLMRQVRRHNCERLLLADVTFIGGIIVAVIGPPGVLDWLRQQLLP